jgi:hypothetical protein
MLFLAHLSWKLKWAFLVVRGPSVNVYIFDFLSRTTRPILTRLGTNHPCVKGIQVCSKKRDSPSPRGDNSGRVKIHWKFLKIFFFRTNWPNSIKLDKNCSWVKGIQVYSNKGPCPLQRGDNHKNVKMGWARSFKNLLQNQRANFNQTWHKSSLGKDDSSLFKERG